MERLNTLVNKLKVSPPDYTKPTSVKDWFLHVDIRVCEPQDSDTASLWFCLADVAHIIGDQNHWHYKSKHTRNIEMNDKNGRPHACIMLTEQGLYQYLLKSNRRAAHPCQEWVYGLRTSIRRAVVTKAERDNALLKRSIAVRDSNFNLLINVDGCRADYGMVSAQDTDIIERCYVCGVNSTTLTAPQLDRLRTELRYNEPEIVDKLLAEWKLTSAAV